MKKDIITAMQEKIAHQEVEISRLSEELYTQQREVLALRKQLDRLEQTVKNGASFIRATEDETPPPHY